VQRLQDHFIENKFEVVKMEFSREHCWQRKLASDTVCALAEEVVATVFEPGSEDAKNMRENIKECYIETCQGAFISQPFIVVVGRKPITK
jgi:hypothetical protein